MTKTNSKFVYRNNRLPIGWRITGSLRTEAWLGEISPEEATRDDSANEGTATSTEPTTTNRLQVYVSASGSVVMTPGVMAIAEAHPAVLQPHADVMVSSSTFEALGEAQRLKLFANRLAGVKNG
jgi:hypothetical protein